VTITFLTPSGKRVPLKCEWCRLNDATRKKEVTGGKDAVKRMKAAICDECYGRVFKRG
jgi:hypothetical protein